MGVYFGDYMGVTYAIDDETLRAVPRNRWDYTGDASGYIFSDSLSRRDLPLISFSRHRDDYGVFMVSILYKELKCRVDIVYGRYRRTVRVCNTDVLVIPIASLDVDCICRLDNACYETRITCMTYSLDRYRLRFRIDKNFEKQEGVVCETLIHGYRWEYSGVFHPITARKALLRRN